MVFLLALLLAAPLQAAGGPVTLAVPFLPQSEDLCGGAAAAMVFRFFGDRHASVSQFAPLVDRSAGGISTAALENAIQQRGWRTLARPSTIDALRALVRRGQPVLLLIEDRPGRYHYVVAIGADDRSIVVHDPARGPSRVIANQNFERVWSAAKFWSLAIGPDGRIERSSPSTPPHATASRDREAMTSCERDFESAMDDIEHRPGEAETILDRVRAKCPTLPAPVRELSGLRFAEKRYGDAEALATEAVRLGAKDGYTWNLLGASRFLRGDAAHALEAWNHDGRPRVDHVAIAGADRMRYDLLANYVGLEEGDLLTPRAFQLADRRVSDLPDRASSRVSFRPDEDGYAVVDVNVVENATWPRAPIDWAARAAHIVVDREIAVDVPGFTGQGEVWRGAWRWWANRPAVKLSFSAPVGGRVPGVWSVSTGWEAQTYAAGDGESRRDAETTGSIGYGGWIRPSFRAGITAGVLDGSSSDRHLLIGVNAETRRFGDRMNVAAAVMRGVSIDDRASFSTFSIGARAATSSEAQGIAAIAAASLDVVSDASPLSFWSGAGEGRARAGLLRAHRLLHDGTIDGDVFGRTAGTLNLEVRRWLADTTLTPIGVAAFVDAASAARRLSSSQTAKHVDAGGGLRARLPGLQGTLRLDYARGLDDGANAISIGITVW